MRPGRPQDYTARIKRSQNRMRGHYGVMQWWATRGWDGASNHPENMMIAAAEKLGQAYRQAIEAYDTREALALEDRKVLVVGFNQARKDESQ